MSSLTNMDRIRAFSTCLQPDVIDWQDANRRYFSFLLPREANKVYRFPANFFSFSFRTFPVLSRESIVFFYRKLKVTNYLFRK